MSELIPQVPGVGRKYMQVVNQVLTSISAGRLSPGDRLPNERDLAVECGTSRPTVRDALLALELFGVVEIRRGSGCYITERGHHLQNPALGLLDATPQDLLEARLHLEPTMARMCAGRLDLDQIRRLDALIDASDLGDADPVRERRFGSYFQLSQAFHSELAGYCGNSVIAGMTRQLVDVASHPMWALLNGSSATTNQSDVQADEHRQILEAIALGDEDGAAEAMIDHLSRIGGDLFGGHAATIARVRRRRGDQPGH
ncbi:FadR/GntR family transcriptional regulator [Gordonia hankookensis]|uniref:FadR family transcriptional regulator n=1 Tax=Gordonia hankookensis TaxID=589403 RepID=A0ABR7WDZ9_9ACTN|nr:FadR/GntR family transcriptional regulator [Gordonia hankookensis]MBD1320623.1 FadR family transcriptional regulator [Gordonia hankookensis]NDZ92815.1 FadR family transcriptional regulator [Streptomyces sp. SID11726]NEB26616.1 FadR family transcriptional regulator [Streptomyces sp. SID6673]